MAIQARDPRTDSTSSPQTGQQHLGGFADVAGIDLGNGTVALVLVTATRTATTVDAADSSTQLLDADTTRLAATIQNTDTVETAYLGLGVDAVVGQGIAIAPNGIANVPASKVAGIINAIWTGSPSGDAAILATTA
ncbi:MAG TPA: hypothetical protein VGG51_04190 [Candidatus Cybelea sp.]|jgi:hypothetical protein